MRVYPEGLSAASFRFASFHRQGVLLVGLLLDFKRDLEPFFAGSPDALCIVGGDGRIKDVNPAAERAFGLSARDLRAQPFASLILPEDRGRLADHLGKLPTGGAGATFESQGRCADGSLKRWTWTFARSGALLYAMAREVPAERAQDRPRPEFVSLVAHELRSPLTMIKGYLELVLGGEVGDVNPLQREFLGIARASVDGLVALISDLLLLSRMEAGTIEVHRQPVDAAELIQTAACSLRPLIERKGNGLSLSFQETPLAVRVDPDRLGQAVTHLLSNALKYTPAGGHVSCWAGVAGGELRIEVCDTGIGMTAEEQARIFEKFYRASNATTQEEAGAGLGLSVVQALVELHGGTIDVQSEPGRGSVFRVAMPALES